MKADIIKRIELDFGEHSEKAKQIIINKVNNFEHLLKNDRIIRCIVYLSKGSIRELNHNITIALQDPRDIMLYAEYKEGSTFENFKRLRDFNKTFENCEKNVKE